MGAHNICSKCDRALVAWLIQRAVGTVDNIWPAKRSLDKTINGVVCWSHTAEALPGLEYSGLYKVSAYAEVRTSGVIEEGEQSDVPRKSSDDLVSGTFDAFFTTTETDSGDVLGASITAAARASSDADLQQFTAISVRVLEVSQGFNPRNIHLQGNAWVDTIHLEIIASPSNVS